MVQTVQNLRKFKIYVAVCCEESSLKAHVITASQGDRCNVSELFYASRANHVVYLAVEARDRTCRRERERERRVAG